MTVRRANICPSSPQQMNRNTTETGRAKTNHVANEMSGASGKMIVRMRRNDRLGGVPMIVAMPPIEAA